MEVEIPGSEYCAWELNQFGSGRDLDSVARSNLQNRSVLNQDHGRGDLFRRGEEFGGGESGYQGVFPNSRSEPNIIVAGRRVNN